MGNYSSLTFNQLRKECTKNGLCASGNADVLRKRLHAAFVSQSNEEESNNSTTQEQDKPNSNKQPAKSAEENISNKRQKRSIEDDLICPITLELPMEPVTAEDGQVYEKEAIEMHFESRKGISEIKSPITNLPMGKRLMAAPHTKNIIEISVENGTISGDLASRWKERIKEKSKMEALVKKAEQGDIRAMEKVGSNYTNGRHGFRKDSVQAYLWFDRACTAGSVWGTAQKGHMMALGFGTSKNAPKGLLYVAMADCKGSDWAAYCLGMDYYGLQLTKEETVYYLTRCLGNCRHKNLPNECKEKAREKLANLLGSEGTSDTAR